MNNPLSDGNESVIDIFVLGRSEAGTLELVEQLEHQEYRVTLFTEGLQLIETLCSGKPNLVICDTLSFGQEAYEYCRQIKSDDGLWMIPVMILTRASSLSDLLYVLDSNGDNFIAKPYDVPYLLSLVEGMLTTPVERQTTDLIKTQFKIQHDDRIFVVTADRRKLLEFLLSAFEIAVKNSEDLSSALTELRIFSSRLKTLESAGMENARLIDVLSASVRKKEQDERSLKEDLEETEQVLDEKTAEIGQLSRELGEVRILHSTAEEHIRLLLVEKDKTAVSHHEESSLLAEQITSLSQELSVIKTGLDAEKQAHEEETARSADLALTLKDTSSQKEQLETSLQDLTLIREHLESALSSEKNRVQSAEQEIKNVLQAKALSEENLTRLIDEYKDTSRQQNDEILRLKSGLEAEGHRCTLSETHLETARKERDQLQATHEMTCELQKKQLEDLQELHDATVSTVFAQERELKILRDELVIAHANREKAAVSAASVAAAFNETRVEIEEREWKIQSLEKQILDAGISKETSDEKARVLIASLEQVQSALNTEKEQRAALEEQLKAVIHERETTLQSIRDAHEKTKTELDLNKENLTRLDGDLEAAALLRTTLQGDIASASSRIKELEHELKSAVQLKEQSYQQLQSLSKESEEIKAALRDVRLALTCEKEQCVVLNEQLSAAIRERDETLQSVRGAHDQTKTDLEVHRNDLMQMNRDLEAARQHNSVLQGDFNAALLRINELEHEKNSLVQGKEQTGQQARSLSDELEGTKAELDTERRIRRSAEVNLQKSVDLNSRLEGDITRSTAERERLTAALEDMKTLNMTTFDKARAVTGAKEHIELEFKSAKEEHARLDELHAAQIQQLNQEIERFSARQRDLEEAVTTLESAKSIAEARADALSDEIRHARIALADEWEHHMNDEERLAATEAKAFALEQSLTGTDKESPERERKWAVVVRHTDLPAEISSSPRSLVLSTPSATQEVPLPQLTPDRNREISPSSGIEDLFEDESPIEAADRISGGPEYAGPAAETQSLIVDLQPDEEPVSSDLPAAEQAAGDQDVEYVEETDENNEDEPIPSLDDFVSSPSSYGISFNRRQWFDLLKWSHHSGALSQEQRMQIVRMGRLIQNGRKLTKKQDEQVRELIVLVQTLGYRFH